MCDSDCGHPVDLDADPDPNHSSVGRRSFLLGAGGLLAAGAVAPLGTGLLIPTRAAAAGLSGVTAITPLDVPDGLAPIVNAMHIHSSFSELQGSYDGQLAEAQRLGVQVMWPTDHDFRMEGLTLFKTLRFLKPERSNGVSVTYPVKTTGTLKTHTAALVRKPVSPNDPKGGAAHLVAQGKYLATAWSGVNVQSSMALRTNITGTYISLDLNAVSTGPNAWGEVLMTHSWHPAQSGRPQGQYQLAYRFTTTQPSGYQVQGLLGIVWVQVQQGWNSAITLDPTTDIAALWPDMAAFAGDNNLFDLWFRAGSANKTRAEVYFANVLINRTLTGGDDPLDVQAGLLAALQPTYAVEVRRGLEVSFNPHHSNWFGGAFSMPDYPTLGPGDITAAATQLIHGYGGLASLNHPFGTSATAPVAQATQDATRQALAAALIANSCYGVDIIEVGYHQRGGVSLETLMALADTLARNGIWLTYNGTSDNHTGTLGSWSNPPNTFATGLWAASTAEADLLAALQAGRAYCGELGVFAGSIWLQVDDCPMGSISVRPDLTRMLSVAVNGLPASGYVEVIQGPVDYAGSGAPDPGTVVVTTIDVSVFALGPAAVPLDTSVSSFVRVNLYDSGLGRHTAFTGPTWLLVEDPPSAVPAARAV